MAGDEVRITESASRSAAIFTPVTAPVLRSVDPKKVVQFFNERERYEMEILGNQVEIPSLKMVPYTASIDRLMLKNLLFLEKMENIALDATIETISDEQQKTYINSLVKRSSNTYEPTQIEQALSSLSMPMEIVDPEARITQYCCNFFYRLESIGCIDFRTDNPKKTVQLLLQRIQTPALRSEMKKRIQFDVSLEKNVKSFIRILTAEARSCQKYGPIQSQKTSNGAGKQDSSVPNRQPKPLAPTSASATSSDADLKKGKDGRKVPICLLPAHREKGVRHYVRDCPDCTPQKEKKLVEEFKKKSNEDCKEVQRAKSTNSLQPKIDRCNGDEPGVLFSAVFGGKIRETVCADIGSDANLMGSGTV